MYRYTKWWNRDITVVELANFMVQEVNLYNFMSLIRNTSAYKILCSILYISPYFIMQSKSSNENTKDKDKGYLGTLRYSYSALLHEKTKEPSNQATKERLESIGFSRHLTVAEPNVGKQF